MALTDNLNYLSPSNFKLTLEHEHYANTQFFVHSFDHPAVSVTPANLPTPRITVPMAGDTISYGDLTITLLIDENMIGYEELYKWLLRNINEKQSNDSMTPDEIPTQMDMKLSILTSKIGRAHV